MPITNFKINLFIRRIFFFKEGSNELESEQGYFTCLVKDYIKVIKGRKKIDFCCACNYIVIAFLNETEYEAQLSAIRLQSLLARSTSRDCLNRTRL